MRPNREILGLAVLVTLAAAGTASAADAVRGSAPITVAAPPAALPRISGDLSFEGGYSWQSDTNGAQWQATTLTGLGRVNLWRSPSSSLQLDASGDSYLITDNSRQYQIQNFAGHWSWRNPNSGLFGLMASIGQSGDANVRAATIAAEGQWYMGPATFYAQAGYSSRLSGFNTANLTAGYVHGELRYFLGPNLMVSGNAGYSRVDDAFFNDTDNLWRWGATIEKMMPNLPISAFVSYQGHRDDWVSGYQMTENSVRAGIKLRLNQDSLMGADRKSSTLFDFNPVTGINPPLNTY